VKRWPANSADQSLLACNFGGQNGFGSEIRLVALRLRPSLRAARRASFPLCCGGSTTLFDAEERLLKRCVRLLDALELIWTTNGCLRPGVRTVSSTAPGQGKGVGEEPPFPRPVTKGLGQSHIVGGSYVYVAAPIGPGLSERTNWERRGDKKDLLPENRLRIRMLPAGSR